MSRKDPRVEVHLSQKEVYMADPVVDQAYDDAMDSLAQSQRNELLAQVSAQRAQAKLTVLHGTGKSTPQVQKRTEPLGFWKRTLWCIVMVVGWTFTILGWLYTTLGDLLRKWGESLR